MLAKIYRPAKTAMQSGKGKASVWLLEFEAASARSIDPLMGWTSSTDMDGQVRLSFETRDEAVAAAKRLNLAFRVIDKPDPKRIIKAYSDNFATGRKQPWTH
jgi:hypothetical protein